MAARRYAPASPAWLAHMLGLATTRAQPEATSTQRLQLAGVELGVEGAGGLSRIVARRCTPASLVWLAHLLGLAMTSATTDADNEHFLTVVSLSL